MQRPDVFRPRSRWHPSTCSTDADRLQDSEDGQATLVAATLAPCCRRRRGVALMLLRAPLPSPFRMSFVPAAAPPAEQRLTSGTHGAKGHAAQVGEIRKHREHREHRSNP